jgi:hypothetical protein
VQPSLRCSGKDTMETGLTLKDLRLTCQTSHPARLQVCTRPERSGRRVVGPVALMAGAAWVLTWAGARRPGRTSEILSAASCPSDKIGVDKPAQYPYTRAKSRRFSAFPWYPRPADIGGPSDASSRYRFPRQASRRALSPPTRPVRHEAPTPHPPLSLLEHHTSPGVALVAMRSGQGAGRTGMRWCAGVDTRDREGL